MARGVKAMAHHPDEIEIFSQDLENILISGKDIAAPDGRKIRHNYAEAAHYAPVVRFVSNILQEAITDKVDCIVLNQQDDLCLEISTLKEIRGEIGVLRDYGKIPESLSGAVLARLKLLARIGIDSIFDCRGNIKVKSKEHGDIDFSVVFQHNNMGLIHVNIYFTRRAEYVNTDIHEEGEFISDSITKRLESLDSHFGLPVAARVRELFPELAELERTEAEGRVSWVERVGEPERQPLPEKAPALWAQAKEPGDTPPTFIQRHYAPWLGKGLSRADVRHLDPQLYMALANWRRKNDLPEGFALPTKSEKLAAEAPSADSHEAAAVRRLAYRLDKARSRSQ